MLRTHTTDEETRENRLRDGTLLPESTPTRTVPTPPMLTEQTEPAPQKAPSRTKTRGKSWWRENITENPMYYKENLLKKRALEKKKPLRRLWDKVWIPLTLGMIYFSVYVFISGAYNSGYEYFQMHANDSYNGYLIKEYGAATNYAMSMMQGTSIGLHCFLLVLQFLVMAIVIPALAATKITSEREKMNWNALLLSRLTPSQVLVGKVAPVIGNILKVMMMALPAVILTGYIGETFVRLDGHINDGLTFRGVFLAQVIILAAALMNTVMAFYYSLREKSGAKAGFATARWFGIPTLGMGVATAIFYALYAMFCYVTGNNNVPSPPNWLDSLFWANHVINPMFALYNSLLPSPYWNSVTSNSYPFSNYFWITMWYVLPIAYPAVALAITVRTAKKMLAFFHKAPKDASG